MSLFNNTLILIILFLSNFFYHGPSISPPEGPLQVCTNGPDFRSVIWVTSPPIPAEIKKEGGKYVDIYKLYVGFFVFFLSFWLATAAIPRGLDNSW